MCLRHGSWGMPFYLCTCTCTCILKWIFAAIEMIHAYMYMYIHCAYVYNNVSNFWGRGRLLCEKSQKMLLKMRSTQHVWILSPLACTCSIHGSILPCHSLTASFPTSSFTPSLSRDFLIPLSITSSPSLILINCSLMNY